MTDRSSNFYPKHPQILTPLSDVGLEPKKPGAFQSLLPTITELVEHQHLVLREQSFYDRLLVSFRGNVKPTRTMLYRAIHLRSLRSVRFLVEKGADIRDTSRRIDRWGNTRLHLALSQP
jgi:hypothetical protein